MHEHLAILGLAESAWRWGAAWIICGLALLIGLAGRRRLPAGVGDGLFVAGLSGLLFAAYLPMHDPEQAGLQLCAVLTALAVLWRFAPRQTQRGTAPTGSEATAESALAQAPTEPRPNPSIPIASHAVLLCGAAVAGLSLRFSAADPREQRLAATLCLMLLFALALRPRTAVASGLSWFALLGLLACALRLWVQPDFAVWSPHAISAFTSLGGLLALVAALLPIVMHWRQRRLTWQVQAERLLEPPPRLPLWWAGVQILSGLTGIAALVVRYEPLAPFGPALATLAASTPAYRQRSTSGGTLALVLACEAVILLALAWVPNFGFNALLGVALAGLWMIWLARFWRQQLHAGEAWTFAGQLVGPARRIAHAAAVACFVLAVSEIGFGRLVPAMPVRQGLAAGLLFLIIVLFSRTLARDAAQQESTFGALAACLAMLAAVVPLQAALATFTRFWSQWPLLLAFALLLLAAVTNRSHRRPATLDWVYNAYIGGFLPVMILCGAVGPGSDTGLSWLTALPIALIGFGLRWSRDGKAPTVPAFEARP